MADRDLPIDPRPAPSSAPRAVLGITCVSLLAVAVVLWVSSLAPRKPSDVRLPAARAPRAAYVGSRSCAPCHPGEFAAHSRSGHAHTLRRAGESPPARRLDGATVPDPDRPGVSWSYTLRDGRLSTVRREAGAVERFVIDYAFGSGRHATTFVTLTDRTPDHPAMLEHRLTVYAHKEAPDITPGQGTARRRDIQGIGPSGRSYPTAGTLKCFECHTILTSDRGPGVLDEATMIPNVGCERCHGPGRTHVEAARRGASAAELAMPFGTSRDSARDEMRLCGSCHRLPETVEPALIRPDNPGFVRFQPVGLMQSACFRRSPGGLSCSTCHEPHARTSGDRLAYETACLSCHAGPSQTVCRISPKTGCIDCHMPRRDVTQGMMMTDHWIRSRPATDASPSAPNH